MKFTRLSILGAVVLGASLSGITASIKDLPTREVNGRNYYYYEVAPKETVYSICHRLGITKDELVKSNPSVADGLRWGTVLFFPVDGEHTDESSSSPSAASSAEPKGVSIITHKVEKGQTIYGIATRYGISTKELIEQNPIVSEGLKAGQMLHISVPAKESSAPQPSAQTAAPASAASTTVSHEASASSGYIVKKKETFYSIAHANGITVKELEAANPGITVLREGQVLNIPTASAPAKVSVDQLAEAAGVKPDSLNGGRQDGVPSVSVNDLAAAAGVPEQGTELSVAVVLPFMLNEETPSKSAQRYTEFYKGFLLAADSLRSNGTPVRISVFDTEGSTAKVHDIIANPELKKHRLIIAPDNVEQFAMLGEFGRVNGIKVLNDFIVRDETYRTNPAVMHGNIPSALMFEKAADVMVARMAYTVPVFLNLTDGANDKTEFIDAVKKRLDGKGTKYKTITVDGKLTKANLKELPAEGNYTFILNTGRQSDVNRLLPGLIEWRDEAVMPSIKVVGYPEWITFRGETLSNMHNLNTLVYSRFFDNEESPRSRRIESKFKQWYGVGMENAIPRQGILGFDTGMFVLNYLKNSAHSYDGVQNGFSFFVPEGAAGDCNGLLYIINYRPGGLIEKASI